MAAEHVKYTHICLWMVSLVAYIIIPPQNLMFLDYYLPDLT